MFQVVQYVELIPHYKEQSLLAIAMAFHGGLGVELIPQYKKQSLPQMGQFSRNYQVELIPQYKE